MSHESMSQPSADTTLGGRARRRWVWPWAVSVIALVALIAGGAYVGRKAVASRSVPAPVVATSPALPVVAVAHPEAGVALLALDPQAGRLVALAVPQGVACPPTGGCPTPPQPDHVVVMASDSGATLATTPLTGEAAPAAASVALLADSARHRAYAIAPRAVTIFSTTDGARVGGYALPADAGWARESGAALDPATNRLYLAGATTLLALDASTGRPLARAALDAPPVDGPTLLPGGDTLYLLTATSPLPRLLAFDARALAARGGVGLAPGARLGPPDANGLYLFGGDGAVTPLTAGDLAVALAGGAAEPFTHPDDPALRGAQALGFGGGAGTRTTLVARADGVTAYDATTAQPRATLPIRVTWPRSLPLPVDTARGLLYLPTDSGAILIAQTTPASADSAPLALARSRAALARFLPAADQDPPFVTAETFPLWQGTREQTFWIHFSDLGWRDYPGAASSQVAPEPGQSGAYRVTFTITWNQLFQRTHRWEIVERDGAARLTAESGDGLP